MSPLAIITLMVVLLIPLSVFAQESYISVQTDKPSYSEGETILVTGEVSQLLGGYSLSIRMMAPNGNIVAIDRLTVDADKKFSTSFAAGGSLMIVEGTYTITVQYGDNKNNLATTSFGFGGSTGTPSTGGDSKVTGTTISVQGSYDVIGYEMIGGKLHSVIPDYDFISLILRIDTTIPGSITLTIPRDVMDSQFQNSDSDFIVIVDGDEPNYREIDTTSQSRTLYIELPSGAEEVEIIGSTFDNEKTNTIDTTPKPRCPPATIYDYSTNSCILDRAVVSDTTSTPEPTSNYPSNNDSLQKENNQLKLENKQLKNQINILQEKLDNLQSIINEQISVIMNILQELKNR